MKGIPKNARRKGSRRERVETAYLRCQYLFEDGKDSVICHTFSGLPLKPTSVPLRE